MLKPGSIVGELAALELHTERSLTMKAIIVMGCAVMAYIVNGRCKAVTACDIVVLAGILVLAGLVVVNQHSATTGYIGGTAIPSQPAPFWFLPVR